MRNVLSFLESLTKETSSLDESFIGQDLLYNLAIRCGFEVLQQKEEGEVKYKLKRLPIPCQMIYTRNNSNQFDFFALADLHIGHPDCRIDIIKLVLENAVKQGITDVYIAGDIFDGVPYGIDKESANKIFESQISEAFSIFRKFHINVHAIPGNHDFTFDLIGILAPLNQLADRLGDTQCNFKAYNGYIQDFEIAGVAMRMMHLDRYYHESGVRSPFVRIEEFEKKKELISKTSDGVEIPIRFINCGHLHKSIEFYDHTHNIFIEQPGSFVRGENEEFPFIRVKGKVTDELEVIRLRS